MSDPATGARVIDGRLKRLKIKAWAGDRSRLAEALGVTVTVDESLIEPLAARGWDLSLFKRSLSIAVSVPPCDHRQDWYDAHVHPTPGATASLTDLRASYADYMASRRQHLNKGDRDKITSFVSSHGFKRTSWAVGKTRVSGFKDMAVTFEPGVSVGGPDRSDPGPALSDDLLRVRLGALASLASPYDLERAFISLADAHPMLCGACGRLALGPRHRGCEEN